MMLISVTMRVVMGVQVACVQLSFISLLAYEYRYLIDDNNCSPVMNIISTHTMVIGRTNNKY